MRIIEAFNKNLNNHLNAIALQEGNRTLTYKNFDQITNFIASRLEVSSDVIIGLEFNKSINYLLALFAVLKKGNPFITLNTELPEERLKYMTETLKVTTIINDSILNNIMEKFNINEDYSVKKSLNLNINDLAYVIFTSGSTGNPKGVKVTHRGIYNIIKQQIDMFELKVGSKLLLTNSISFDASLSDIFSTLLSGSTLCIDSKSINIIEAIKSNHITHIDISPSILNLLYKEEVFSKLTTIIVGGELLSESVIQHLAHKVKIVNAYGPTETTICSSMKVIKCIDDINCIGNPIQGLEYILEDGELIIGGIACADGYCNIESDKFFMKKNNGYYKTGDYVELKNNEYYFLGRKDRQVKVKGFRIELEEVEKLIKREAGIDSVAVIFKNNQIICFSLSLINKEILKSVPYYMLPNNFINLSKFPINSNGKIDYKVLETLIPERQNRNLVDVFEEVLDRKVTEEDDWNSLGGDSLSLIHLMVVLEEEGFNIQVEDILRGIPIKDLLSISNNTVELTTEFLKSSVKPIKFNDFAFDNVITENVLITGVTGFLGTYLLEMLLKESLNEQYYCLIRATSIQEAKNKLNHSFLKHNMNLDLLNDERIHIILGDISLDYFGLSEKEYNDLKQNINKVLHSAALVNNLLPYDVMYNTNVKGTMEVIKLKKPIHYISTLSVFVGTDKNEGIVYENDDLSDIKYVYGGYAQSKYIAEYLVRESNLPHVIYRLGLLTGDMQKKHRNNKEFLTMLLDGIVKIKTLPDVNLEDFSFDVSPIDFVTGIIRDIYKENNNYNNTYHIANTKGASLELISNTLSQYGYNIKKVNTHEFKRLIFNTKLDTNIKSLLLTMCRFDQELYNKYRFCDLFQKTGITFDMTNTIKIMNSDFPEVNQKLIGYYIDNIKG